jgi:hypothetical protein
MDGHQLIMNMLVKSFVHGQVGLRHKFMVELF